MLRAVDDQLSLWDAILPAELLVLPGELARVDALLARPKGFEPNVDVLWECVVPVEDALPTDVLKRELPQTNWDRLQMSGTFLKTELITDLEDLWSSHLASIAEHDTGLLPGQAILTDAVRRKQIEDAAQDRLMEHYRNEGWTVTDTGTATRSTLLPRGTMTLSTWKPKELSQTAIPYASLVMRLTMPAPTMGSA